jgi:hypothetical protein
MRIHPLLPALVLAASSCAPAPAAERPPTLHDVVRALDAHPAHLRTLHTLKSLGGVRVVHVDALGGGVQALHEGVDERVPESARLRAALGGAPSPNLAALRRALDARRIPLARVLAVEVDSATGIVTVFRS